MKQVSTINMEFIEHSIQQALEFCYEERVNFDGDCANVYFAGRTLVIDVREHGQITDCITLCHEDEDYGWFSDGTFRGLLSIKALKLMETLMNEMGVQHNKKWVA